MLYSVLKPWSRKGRLISTPYSPFTWHINIFQFIVRKYERFPPAFNWCLRINFKQDHKTSAEFWSPKRRLIKLHTLSEEASVNDDILTNWIANLSVKKINIKTNLPNLTSRRTLLYISVDETMEVSKNCYILIALFLETDNSGRSTFAIYPKSRNADTSPLI